MTPALAAWYDLRDLSGLSREITEWAADWGPDWLASILSGLIGAIGVISVIGPALLVLIWVERKVIARMQSRYGPNRVGPRGLLQPVADAVKLILKEELAPRAADKLLFFLPPVLVFIPAILIWGVLPFGPNMQVADLNAGVLFLLAVSGTNAIMIFLAGWASNNKYALFGAMRVIAMSISYEIPAVLALLTIAFFTGTLSVSEMVIWQQQNDVILLALLPMSAFMFLFASTAELNRTPIDISEAESEIVAGYHTEYSGMRFGLFYAVELANTLVISAFMATFFLGGWWLWGLDEWIPPWMILLTKTGAMYFVFVWMRGTLPRFRIDQLMGFCWKFLVPAGLVFLAAAAVERTLLLDQGWDPAIALPIYGVINFTLTALLLGMFTMRGARSDRRMPSRPIMARGRVGGLQAARELSNASSGY